MGSDLSALKQKKCLKKYNEMHLYEKKKLKNAPETQKPIPNESIICNTKHNWRLARTLIDLNL